MKRVCIVLMLGCSISAFAQNAKPGAEDWDRICKDATAQPLIEPKLTGPLGAAQLADCSTARAYYGILGSKRDYAAALQCGWYQRAHPDSAKNSGDYYQLFPGVGTLMMQYANGLGVARNYDTAIRFACEYDAEQKVSRLERLTTLKDGKQDKAPLFDVCDDVTSRRSEIECEDVKQALNEAEHENTFVTITDKLTVAQKRLFDKLRAAEDKFENVRTQSEVDVGFGQLFALQDQGRLGAQFLSDLQRFAKGDATPATAEDVKKLDAQMNAVYQKVMQAPASVFEYGSVKPEGIREAQRAWLQMRDAWMEFAKVAYPRLAPERVLAQLIRLRLNQLQLLPIDIK